MASNYYEKLIEEMNRRNPGALPEDAITRLPDSIKNEFDSRLPQPDVPVVPTAPTAPTPDISPEDLPEPTFKAPPIEPSSFDVNVSDTTPRMEGRPESLPSLQSLPESAAPPTRRWELEEDAPSTRDPKSDAVSPSIPADTSATSDRKAADAALLSTGQDEKKRAELLAALEKKRKLKIIPELGAGIGDAISASASAFGANAPGGSMQRMVERHDKQKDQGKLDIENKLRDDPKSDISKQYQNLVAQFLQKDMADPSVLGLTANQIAEKLPAIEKIASLRHDEDMRRLTAGGKDKEFTPAQKTFDQEMAKLTAEFTDSGGIKAAQAADDQLVDTINRFKELGPGFFSRLGAAVTPDAARGLMQPEYKAIEQEVRQNVTELLRSTLGAQFTEREGERIFSQTFDPTLKPEINLRRMESLRTKLHTIAEERARAVDYFTEHRTFDGYKIQSSPTWTYGTTDTQSEPESTSRRTKSGYDYSVAK